PAVRHHRSHGGRDSDAAGRGQKFRPRQSVQRLSDHARPDRIRPRRDGGVTRLRADALLRIARRQPAVSLDLLRALGQETGLEPDRVPPAGLSASYSRASQRAARSRKSRILPITFDSELGYWLER